VLVFLESEVKIEEASSVEEYLKLAGLADEWKNYRQTEAYANKIIELEPNNYQAWLYKGKAVGRQTTPDDNRFAEAVDCFVSAIANAPAEAIGAVKEDVKLELMELALAMMQRRCELFDKYPEEDETEDLLNDLLLIADTLKGSAAALGMDVSDIITAAVALVTDQIKAVFERMKKAYKAMKQPSKDEASQLALAGACCCLVLDTIINDFAPNENYENVLRYQTIGSINLYLMGIKYYFHPTGEVKFASRELWLKLNQKVENCNSKIKELDPQGLIKQAQIAEAEEKAAEERRIKEAKKRERMNLS